MVDKKGRLKHVPKGGTFKDFPLKRRGDFSWVLIKLKDHPNWKKDVQALSLTFGPAYKDLSAQGKFLIWRIELIKLY
ncbi:MAG: hypothetical protein ACE5WD_10955 [Candidatus Aminicenantia bacterium]